MTDEVWFFHNVSFQGGNGKMLRMLDRRDGWDDHGAQERHRNQEEIWGNFICFGHRKHKCVKW